MASSLFPEHRSQNRAAAASGANNPLAMIAQLRQMMQGRDPAAIAQMLAQKNPQFAAFVQQWSGRAPEEIARAYGIDWSQIQGMIQ